MCILKCNNEQDAKGNYTFSGHRETAIDYKILNSEAWHAI